MVKDKEAGMGPKGERGGIVKVMDGESGLAVREKGVGPGTRDKMKSRISVSPAGSRSNYSRERGKRTRLEEREKGGWSAA